MNNTCYAVQKKKCSSSIKFDWIVSSHGRFDLEWRRYETSVRRASQKSSESTGQAALGRLGSTVLLSARCRRGRCRHPTAVLDGVSQRQSLATGAERLDGGSRRRDDDGTMVSSSFRFSSLQLWPASAGKLDGGSRRRGGLCGGVQFVVALAGQRWKAGRRITATRR